MLAVNPLLLTTLLLVRRWIGELPRRRSILYAKAIEVLLMTWNVEGHEPIDDEEAVPQLAYLALRMLSENKKQVPGAVYRKSSRRHVKICLTFSDSRRSL